MRSKDNKPGIAVTLHGVYNIHHSKNSIGIIQLDCLEKIIRTSRHNRNRCALQTSDLACLTLLFSMNSPHKSIRLNLQTWSADCIDQRSSITKYILLLNFATKDTNNERVYNQWRSLIEVNGGREDPINFHSRVFVSHYQKSQYHRATIYTHRVNGSFAIGSILNNLIFIAISTFAPRQQHLLLPHFTLCKTMTISFRKFTMLTKFNFVLEFFKRCLRL